MARKGECLCPPAPEIGELPVLATFGDSASLFAVDEPAGVPPSRPQTQTLVSTVSSEPGKAGTDGREGALVGGREEGREGGRREGGRARGGGGIGRGGGGRFDLNSAWLLPSLEHFLRFSVAVYGYLILKIKSNTDTNGL